MSERDRNPRWETPGTDPALHPNRDPLGSLAEGLGGIVDEARQLVTDLGLRPYRVFAVRVRWTGGAVGRGEPRAVSEIEFLPTPEIVDTSSLRGEQRSGGLVERGTLQIRKLSPRYTEDEIRGMFGCAGLHAGEQVWIETRIDARDGSTERRRFVVDGAPFRDAFGFQWKARLIRQDEDRTRSGRVPDGT